MHLQASNLKAGSSSILAAFYVCYSLVCAMITLIFLGNEIYLILLNFGDFNRAAFLICTTGSKVICVIDFFVISSGNVNAALNLLTQGAGALGCTARIAYVVRRSMSNGHSFLEGLFDLESVIYLVVLFGILLSFFVITRVKRQRNFFPPELVLHPPFAYIPTPPRTAPMIQFTYPELPINIFPEEQIPAYYPGYYQSQMI